MEEQGKMTIKNILEITVADLNQIMVPVEYADTISRPLCIAVANLKACIQSMENETKPEEETTVLQEEG